MSSKLFVNPDVGSNREFPNLSLAYAATHFNTKIIDMNTKPEPKNRFLKHKVDSLGISIQPRAWDEANTIAKDYKKKYPKSKVCTVNTKAIDILCCYPFLKFNNDLVFDADFSDELPFPNFELFDSFNIFQKNWKSGEWNYPILTSTGCPYSCVYCAARLRRMKLRSIDNCIEELKQAKKRWGIKNFEVLDDCFNFNKDRVLEFCEAVKPLKLGWVTCNGLRADRFDEDIAKAMAESGAFYLGFGIESADSEVLKTIKKGETLEQIENAINIAKKYFKRMSGYLIIGLPESSYEKDLKNIEWILNKGIIAHFSFHVPFEKGIQYAKAWTDPQFHGDNAYPISEVYPKHLQMRIYMMTEAMRSVDIRNLIPKLFTSFRYSIIYRPSLLPKLFAVGVRRVMERWAT